MLDGLVTEFKLNAENPILKGPPESFLLALQQCEEKTRTLSRL